MADVHIKQLKDKDGLFIAPEVPEKAIYDTEGVRLDVKLRNIKDSLSNKLTVVRDTPPNETTLKYAHNGITYSFVIGDEVLVRNQNSGSQTDNNVFYKLYSLTNGKAYWAPISTLSEDAKHEKVTIVLKSNQPTPDNNLVGARIKVQNTDDGTILLDTTWYGNEIGLNVRPGINCVVTVGSVQGYTTPTSASFQTKVQSSRILNFTYNTCLVKLNAITNQVTHTDVQNATIAINGEKYNNGDVVRVPLGSSITVVYDDVPGYKSPANATYGANNPYMEIGGVYSTSLITVNVIDPTNDPLEGTTLTLAYDNFSENVVLGADGTTRVKVPLNKTFNLTVSPKVVKETPSYSGVANQINQTVTLTYRVLTSGVFLEDTNHKLYNPSDWDHSKVFNSIVVFASNKKIRIKNPTTAITVRWPDTGVNNQPATVRYTETQAKLRMNGYEDFALYINKWQSVFNAILNVQWPDGFSTKSWIPSLGEVELIKNNIQAIKLCLSAVGIRPDFSVLQSLTRAEDVVGGDNSYPQLFNIRENNGAWVYSTTPVTGYQSFNLIVRDYA